MKKTIAAALVLLMTLCLAACGPQNATPPPTSGGQALPGGGTESIAPPQNTTTALSLLVSGNEGALGDTLSALAAADGNSLTVQKLAAGSGYVSALADALTGENAPDLFWVPDEDSLWAAVGLGLCADLSGAGSSAAMRALAGLIPSGSFLTQDGGAYGLPAGYTAQGNLVNLSLLAVLLGTQNITQLRADLAACTAQQWSAMVAALDTYLQRPGVMQIRLGKSSYTTPGYRPRQAQGLRGIYAIGSETAGMLPQTVLQTVYAAAFEDWQQEAGQDSLAKARLLVPPLASMGGLFELESNYMAGPDGPVRRGEDFLSRESLTDGAASALFANGTALVMRGSLETAQQLQAANPHLEGQLALVPLKLPAPPEEDEEDSSSQSQVDEDANSAEGDDALEGETSGSESASDSTAEGGESASQPQGNSGEAPTQPQRDLAAAIEANNSLILFDITGYLCVNAHSANQGAALSLLLRLYTTQDGRAAYLENTGRPLFGSQAYTDTLVNQVVSAIAGGGARRTVISAAALEGSVQQVATFVREEMLPVSTWDTDIETEFLITCLKALGYYWELPDVETP